MEKVFDYKNPLTYEDFAIRQEFCEDRVDAIYAQINIQNHFLLNGGDYIAPLKAVYFEFCR